MTRTPVTVTDDQMRLIEGATEAGLYQSRSAVVREAFREYFADNPILVAVLLTELEDVSYRDIVASVDADPATVTEVLQQLGEAPAELEAESLLDEIAEDFARPDAGDSA